MKHLHCRLRLTDGSVQQQEQLHCVERSLTEILAELKQLHAALTLQAEREPPLVIPTISRLNDRLLEQNTELSNIVSQFEEKRQLRNTITQLEEDVWQLRQTQQINRVKQGWNVY
ncbi:A-kinase anchor protein 9-like [Amphiura filiformis]|uniref:A-kinase anchor protein 9-like n=1 Tax=Amphiura filiformis TaxID=82378 RepID=UPI003B21A232